MYQSEEYGFSLQYPSSWVAQKAIIADEAAPVSIEISTGLSGDIEYSNVLALHGHEVYVQVSPYGETCYIFERPEGVRIALRDSSHMAAGGDDDLISTWQPVLEMLLENLALSLE